MLLKGAPQRARTEQKGVEAGGVCWMWPFVGLAGAELGKGIHSLIGIESISTYRYFLNSPKSVFLSSFQFTTERTLSLVSRVRPGS